MKITSVLLFAVVLSSSAGAQQAPPNPQIDFAAFVKLADELQETREAHRLPVEEFLARASEEGALLLDTRSAAAFEAGHIEGAVNLPFSDFTAAKLAKAIGDDPNRSIFIYCNNNFSDGVFPVETKLLSLALNIPTFINLHGYGYHNVWEMADVVPTSEVAWVGTGVRSMQLPPGLARKD